MVQSIKNRISGKVATAQDVRKRTAGFTLIEILVVIGIISILATIVIIAINPAKQFAQARNTQRQSNINSILNAVGQHTADNKGVFAGGTPACPTTAPGNLAVSTATSSIFNGAAGAGDADLSCLTPTYIPSFPTDPTAASGNDTGYDVSVDAVGRVTICAPAAAEAAIPGSTAICVIR